jgi:hypothetical protein
MLTVQEKFNIFELLYNHRLSTAREMLKRIFGILAKKVRILHMALNFRNSVVKLWCCLHNCAHENYGIHVAGTLYECRIFGTKGSVRSIAARAFCQLFYFDSSVNSLTVE